MIKVLQPSLQTITASLVKNLINITPVIAQASHGISAFIKEQSTIDENAPQDAALVKSPPICT
jgi:hypothetical protein